MKRTKPVKKMLAALSVFLLLLFCTACGRQAQTETDDIVSDFVFGDDGYAYAPAPFGSTREEVEAAIGREMDEQGSNPHTEPFEYMSYITPNQDVQLSGPSLKSRVDAQFTDEDGLFAITFNSAVLAEQRAVDARHPRAQVVGIIRLQLRVAVAPLEEHLILSRTV